MNVTVLGAGRIGGNIARQLARAGHHALTLSFARDTAALQALADGLGAQVAAPAEAVDAEAKRITAGLIEDAGYAPVDLGATETCQAMEAPRRPGAVYGEEWRLPGALEVVAALRAGRPVPPTPHYASPGA